MNFFDLMAKITLDSSQYEKGLKNAEKKSLTFKDAVGKASKAVKVVSGAVATGGASLMALATKSSSATDRIDKMSQKIGLSRKAYQEWDYIMSQNGASVDSQRNEVLGENVPPYERRGDTVFITLNEGWANLRWIKIYWFAQIARL